MLIGNNNTGYAEGLYNVENGIITRIKDGKQVAVFVEKRPSDNLGMLDKQYHSLEAKVTIWGKLRNIWEL